MLPLDWNRRNTDAPPPPTSIPLWFFKETLRFHRVTVGIAAALCEKVGMKQNGYGTDCIFGPGLQRPCSLDLFPLSKFSLNRRKKSLKTTISAAAASTCFLSPPLPSIQKNGWWFEAKIAAKKTYLFFCMHKKIWIFLQPNILESPPPPTCILAIANIFSSSFSNKTFCCNRRIRYLGKQASKKNKS